MLKNYCTTAIRNFLRNKSFSLINIIGLAIGISASLVIFLIVNYDFTFEKFQTDSDRIYRVVSQYNFQGDISHSGGVPIPMCNTVYRELRGVETVSHFRTWMEEKKVAVIDPLKNNPAIFRKEKNATIADKNYFKIIPYQWVAGSASTSLNEPYQVVLTETKAKLYFPALPAADIVGREIVFDDTIRMAVTGIVKDLTENTDFTFNTFISRATIESGRMKPNDWEEWNNTNSATQLFIKLHKQTGEKDIVKQLNAFYKKYEKHDPQDHSQTTFNIQPLRDVHFNSNYDNFDQRLAHKPTLYGLLAIAAFLLILGCINFINLTTAQATQRAKEIGIRKTIGGSKKQLVMQFLGETFFLTLIATFLSIAITPALLKIFSDFIPEGLHFKLFQWPLLFFLLVLVCLISLLSGFYPALVLSSYKPISVLKNQSYKDGGSGRNVRLRKGLSVFQFVIAQVFIIATILVSKQIRYSIDKDPGFRRNAIIYFAAEFNDTAKGNKKILLQKLKEIPEIAMVSLGYSNPTSRNGWTSTMRYMDGKKEIETSVQVTLGDTNYIKLYNLKLVAGTNIPQSDTLNTILVNENYMHVLGIRNPQGAIGKVIKWNGTETPIAGVLADFNQKSLHDPIGPLVVGNSQQWASTFNVLLQPKQAGENTWQTAIAKINKAWKEVYPDHDIDISFLDEKIAKYYEKDQHVSSLLLWASGLSILISCLGLLGLIIYITNQRTKEIGIRKVIGANVSQIISLLSKDFLKLVIIAFIIAIPIAWYSGNQWLQNFAYRTEMSWWIFLSGGSVMMGVSVLILVLKTLRVATANPVKSLRTE